MTPLPKDFTEQTQAIFGDELWNDFLRAMQEEPPVSIRLNPYRLSNLWTVIGGQPVPWCRRGYYLASRPQFTFDPLLHAGAYYVQEASSMFLDEVLRQHINGQGPITALDLCAAPGGKSTLLRTAIGADGILVSNEPNGKRAQILAENIQKWGAPGMYVTNNYPASFSKSGMAFDLILTDVPCSGEGMFRKDEGAIAEWSLDHVQRCSQLQREIVGEAWQCLRPGGLLVYSTCTFNTHENEENVKWILETFDAEILPVETRPEWNITGSLLPGFSAPVSRFIPGRTRGEGLFMAAIRKKGDAAPKPWQKNMQGMRKLKVISENRLPESLPQVELTYEQALQYLRREALALPSDAPRGLLTVSYLGLPLGQVKNIGSRANNLYPKEWRIKSTHHEGKTIVLAQRTPNEQ